MREQFLARHAGLFGKLAHIVFAEAAFQFVGRDRTILVRKSANRPATFVQVFVVILPETYVRELGLLLFRVQSLFEHTSHTGHSSQVPPDFSGRLASIGALEGDGRRYLQLSRRGGPPHHDGSLPYSP